MISYSKGLFILVTESHTCFFRTVLYKMKTVLDFLKKKKRENEIRPTVNFAKSALNFLHSTANAQHKARKLQHACWHLATSMSKLISGCICMGCDSFLSQSAASCQQVCCKFIVKTCYPQA